MITRFLIIFLVGVFSKEIGFAQERFVTLGGPATQIVFALGLGSNVVAVDQSSTQPLEVKQLPQVGYIRAISTEGVLSMRPTRIISTSDLGPAETLKQLTNSHIPITLISSPNRPEEIEQAITQIGKELECQSKAEALIKTMWDKLEQAQALASSQKNKPKVLFVMGAGGSFTAVGAGTKAHTLIELSGGQNIFANTSSYKPVSPEAVVGLNPEIIFVMDPTGDPATTVQQLEKVGGWSKIEAVKNKKIYVADAGWLLNFGSNIGEAVAWMVERLTNRKG